MGTDYKLHAEGMKMGLTFEEAEPKSTPEEIKMPDLLDILVDPDPRLRLVSEPVTDFDEELRHFINSLFFTMRQNDGIGLAAPQVDVQKRILVMHVPGSDARYFINPEIIATKGSIKHKEGCLSIPDTYGFPVTKRFKGIRVKYQGKTGKEFVDEFEGLESVCIQHEIDHLDGKLFTDGRD